MRNINKFSNHNRQMFAQKKTQIKYENYSLIQSDVKEYLAGMDDSLTFDLVVTSPPYNIGKEYEDNLEIADYLQNQEEIITLIAPFIAETGSICWQVGNYVDKNGGTILPLDILLHPIFDRLGFKDANGIADYTGWVLAFHLRRKCASF